MLVCWQFIFFGDSVQHGESSELFTSGWELLRLRIVASFISSPNNRTLLCK